MQFPHQGTWFADYREVVDAARGPVERRIHDYIHFRVSWIQRDTEHEGRDADLWLEWADIAQSNSWSARCLDGTELPMGSAPIFGVGGDPGCLSWNHPETAPSTEVAAYQAWKETSSRCSAAGQGEEHSRQAS